MLYIGYQFGGFQTGFQTFPVKLTSTGVPAYNGNSTKSYEKREYTPSSYELQNQARQNELYKLQQAKLEALELQKANDYKIEALELQRLKESLTDEQLQIELLQLLQQAQLLEQQRLLAEQKLMAFLHEDDALLVLFMSLPFN